MNVIFRFISLERDYLRRDVSLKTRRVYVQQTSASRIIHIEEGESLTARLDGDVLRPEEMQFIF